MQLTRTLAIAVFGLMLVTGQSLGGETASYTGSGNYTAHKLTMTLGNGDIVFVGWNEALAAISTEPPTLLSGKCIGIGRVAEDDVVSNDLYCTFRANDEDAFDIKGHSDSNGAEGEVIGGSGRWAGATGTVRTKPTARSDDSGSFTFELEITTP